LRKQWLERNLTVLDPAFGVLYAPFGGATSWATTTGIERAMAKHEKMLQRILLGRSDANIAFADLRGLLQGLGFDERIRGDHHIFARDGVAEIVNLQPIGSKAKPYQVRQVRTIIIKYKLGVGDEH
jgi:hypothetical protein